MKTKFYFLVILCISFLISQCKKEDSSVTSIKTPADFDGKVSLDWFRLECTLVKETSGFFPPQAARSFGYSGVALYESVAQGWAKPVRLTGQLEGFNESDLPKITADQEYNWAISANAALAEIIRNMFEKTISPENLNKINKLESDWYDQLKAKSINTVAQRSADFGKAVAAAVFKYSKTDGGHESYLDPFQLPYTWPIINGAWIPTGSIPNPLSPRWNSNRPFFKPNVDEAQPPVHAAYSTSANSEFYKEAMNVYNIVTNATSEQKEIARFWADDPFNTCTPTGHTFNIMSQLLDENSANLGTCAIGFAKLGIAENDAFIACWKAKYNYFLIRPVTYLKQNVDPAFATIIGTPPFPAYTSGHATESAAGSRVFTNMFTNGDGYYEFTDRTQIQFGFSVRNFSNFNLMSEECANSRLYGGIHYNMDNLNGLKMGRAIGDNVNRRIKWPN